MDKQLLRKLLIKHEGLRLKAYKDTVGKTTIGVGRNLDDEGITKKEAYELLDDDINRVLSELRTMPIFKQLDSTRQVVLADMTFNLGFAGIQKFTGMWNALKEHDYTKAAQEMLNSKWAHQVGQRAQELATMMRNG